MKTAVLFDMDGVLIDTETVYARCLSMAFQEKGYSIPASDFYCFAGMEFQTKFETIIRERGLTLAAEELAEPYRAAQRKLLLDFAKSAKGQLTLSVYQKNVRAVKFYQRESFQIQHKNIDKNTGEKEYTMIWKQ